jgi:outer membrane protein assembly factor BamB
MPTLARCLAALLLPIALAAAGPAARPAANVAARWSLTIDSRNAAGPWLSVARGLVYCVRDGHVVAIDLRTGRIRWRSNVAVESRPALGGDTLYLPIAHGVIALDSRTGRETGRRRFERTPTLLGAGSTAVAIVNVERRGGESVSLFGFRDRLVPCWQRQLAAQWDRADTIGNATLLLWETTGTGVMALDAGNGDVAAATDGVEDYVGRDRRTLWFSVAGGGLKSLDLDTNRSAAVHNAIVRGAVRVEGATAVAVVSGRLTSIALPGGAQTPLRIVGRWVGGPSNGNIFVARSDGTYAQPLAGGKPIRLAVNTSDTRFLTATGRKAYFATNDGGIVAADLASLAPTRKFASSCRFVEGLRVTADSALVHCDDIRMRSRLYAFDLHASVP